LSQLDFAAYTKFVHQRTQHWSHPPPQRIGTCIDGVMSLIIRMVRMRQREPG
jgi:hypothetical protein